MDRPLTSEQYASVDLGSSARQLDEAFGRFDHSRKVFSLKACDHLLAAVEQCRSGKFDKAALMYMFEYVKAFSWALTDDLKEVVQVGSSPKMKDDSYFRAVGQNLKLQRDQLSSMASID